MIRARTATGSAAHERSPNGGRETQWYRPAVTAAPDDVVTRPARPWVSTVTRDAIRHFAWGVGDANPLWSDPAHAAGSRWDQLIAPPCFLYAVDETTVAPGLDDRARIYRSADWRWFDVIRLGQEIEAEAGLRDQTTVEIDPYGAVPCQLGEVRFTGDHGVLLATVLTECLRPDALDLHARDEADVRYTAEQLQEIELHLLAERARGREPRYWEDVGVGDELTTVVKGPLSIMDIVAWCAGTQGVPHSREGLSEGGLRAEHATGPQQVAWAAQLLTDWAGDDAFLQALRVEVDAPAQLGDTTWWAGDVTRVELRDGQGLVEVDLCATNQLGERTGTGTAVVELPSRAHGDVVVPKGVSQ